MIPKDPFGRTLEEITWKEVPNPLAHAGGRESVLFEVCMWYGDPFVLSNGVVGHIQLWANYYLSTSTHLASYPPWTQLMSLLQFDILAEATGK